MYTFTRKRRIVGAATFEFDHNAAHVEKSLKGLNFDAAKRMALVCGRFKTVSEIIEYCLFTADNKVNFQTIIFAIYLAGKVRGNLEEKIDQFLKKSYDRNQE